MSSRRAVWRWGWRMLRKEWREQLLILGLVFGAVALSTAGALLAFNTAPPEDSLDERSQFFLISEDEAGLERVIATLGDRVGAVERGLAAAAGAADGSVELRASDPTHPQTSGLVALLDGSFPSGPSEAALTPGASRYLGAKLGETVELDGVTIELVGVVEDPTELNAGFVFLDHQDPAPFELERGYVTSESLGIVEEAFDANGVAGGISGSENNTSTRSFLKVITSIVTTLAMMMVGLIVSASFAVVGRRRIRQYGLLGAIGANEKHLRGAAAFNGFTVGLLAGAAGLVAGIVAARAALPLLESSLNYRVSFAIPWTIVWVTLALAVLMSTIAAWWPARSIARQPIVEALAARRPHAKSPRNTTLAGLILTIGGFIVMVTTIEEDLTAPPLIAMVAIIIGVLLLTPLFVALIGKLTGRAALPVRIAGRDLSRFQSRAAAALASIVLVLAIPVGTGMVTASDDSRVQENTNVPADTAIVWATGSEPHENGIGMGPDFASLDNPELLAEISQVFPNSTTVPIEVFADGTPEARHFSDSEPARQAFFATGCDNSNYSTGNDQGEWCFNTETMWIANQDLLDLWSLDLGGADVLTSQTGPVQRRVAPADQEAAFDPATEFPELTATVAELPKYDRFPTVLIAEDAILPTDKRVTVGWLVTNDAPLTEDNVGALRDLMSDGTNAETLTTPDGNGDTRMVVALVGMLVGFAVLAATVTLIRGESADDIRVLDVLGASSGMRRSVAAATAALLAFAGALLAIPIGAIGLVIDNLGPERNFIFAVPWGTVAILFVVFPVLAAVGSGLLSPNPKEIR